MANDYDGMAPTTPPRSPWIAVLLLNTLLLLTVSCAEDVQYPISAVVTSEGALRFANAEDFFQAVDAASELDRDRLDEWEKSIGFNSMRRTFLEAERRLGPALDRERTALLAEYADVLDPGAETPMPRVRANGYAALANRQGIFYIGSTIHHVSANKVSALRNGTVSSIKQLIEPAKGIEAPSADFSAIQSVEYSAGSRLQEPGTLATCGSVYGGLTSTSDRRVRWETRYVLYSVQDAIGNWQYRYRVEWEFWGYKKNLWWWESYPTTYQIYSSGLEYDYLRALSFDGTRHTYTYEHALDVFPYWTSTVDTSNGIAVTWIGDSVQNANTADLRTPFFYKYHQETTSRGTYPTRGVSDCGFCGDGTCDTRINESATSCRSDCGYCGDGVCYGAETTSSCPSDCPSGGGGTPCVSSLQDPDVLPCPI